MRAIYGWRFLFTIALPLLSASLGVGLLTFDLISRVSTGANTEDHERTREIIGSAVMAVQQQLANTASDNAYWDDAVRNIYGPIDEDWVQESWGAPSEGGTNYDVIMVVDRSIPDAITGYQKGVPFKPSTADYFSGGIDALLDRLPKDFKTSAASGTIITTRDGLAVVAASPIIPTSDDMTIDAPFPRYLVFVKLLTAEFVEQIGSQYVIQGLEFSSSKTDAPGFESIQDENDTTVINAKWSDRRPGDIARSSVIRKAAVTLGFMALVVLGVGALCWHLIRTIARRESIARHDSLHDPLTGLSNRAALYLAIDKMANTQTQSVAVAFADLDGFKEVNDTYDHATGDRLIAAVAAGLEHLAPGHSTICRLGGDEFVALFSGEGAKYAACQFAQRLIDFLRTPFDLEGRQAAVGASVGVAEWRGSTPDPHELMRQADIAMYKAKEAGRNRYLVYSPEFDCERDEALEIADELRAIIAAGTLEVAYQPVVEASTRDIVGVEALARWPSSSSRRITPDRFIAVAETNGLIDDLGDLILSKACVAARNWPGLRLAVNVSTVQLKNPQFVQRTLGTIAAAGMDPARIELELTEGTLVDDVAKASEIFTQLRAAGLHIALDDFGTGFSSIGYLRQFNFDRIKIDRSLVDKILTNSAEQHIVQGTLMMAAGLSAAVTAEGVEREDQINILRLTGCQELQGYYFYKPQPESEISRILATAGFNAREQLSVAALQAATG